MTDTPTRADLLPCPFCGGEAKHYHHTPTGIMNTDHIECDNCSNGTCLHETKAEAVTAWNTRAPTADAERIAVLECEVEGLRAELRTAKEPHWFYLGDDCSSEQCRFGIDECINDDFEWDNEAKGDHVLQISGARPVPDMWIALHYFTAAEKDERQDDEAYTYTVHATEEEARAALKGTDHARA